MRASSVAAVVVVVVVVGVDASLIPVNGQLGLNRPGLFVWAGSIIHLLHPPTPHPPHHPPRGNRRGGVADKAGTALELKASLSCSVVPPSLIGPASHLSLLAPVLERSSVKAWR